MFTNVLDYLEESTSKFPEKIAFADEKIALTYRQTQVIAKSIGSHILRNTSAKGPVAVFVSRSVKNVASFLGVIYSGNFYVPIDALLPELRIKSILETLAPVAIIVDSETEHVARKFGYQGVIIDYEEAKETPNDEGLLAGRRRCAISTDPLYAIFTSGSTGVPKGVLISHGSVVDLVEQFTDVFGYNENDVFGNQAPFDFDISVKDIYCTLKNAATMVVIPKVNFSFPKMLIEFLNAHRITTAIWATSALRIVANLKALENERPHYLKRIMFSGEVMPNKVLNYWRKRMPDAMYVNLYGPTEITCNCTYYIVDRPYSDHEALPVGIPFTNTDILVLDEQNQTVKNSDIGEICVRGVSLALGYYNNAEKTAEVFCQNPLNPDYPERIYRTGDLGWFNEEGLLMFSSRKDSQIKHMGHRIELGEVELAANSLPFLEAGCCFYDAKKEKIVLFYQAASECDKEILIGMRKYLPKYMCPNRLIHYSRLPLNKNEKIDRIKLIEDYYNAKS